MEEATTLIASDFLLVTLFAAVISALGSADLAVELRRSPADRSARRLLFVGSGSAAAGSAVLIVTGSGATAVLTGAVGLTVGLDELLGPVVGPETIALALTGDVLVVAPGCVTGLV